MKYIINCPVTIQYKSHQYKDEVFLSQISSTQFVLINHGYCKPNYDSNLWHKLLFSARNTFLFNDYRLLTPTHQLLREEEVCFVVSCLYKPPCYAKILLSRRHFITQLACMKV